MKRDRRNSGTVACSQLHGIFSYSFDSKRHDTTRLCVALSWNRLKIETIRCNRYRRTKNMPHGGSEYRYQRGRIAASQFRKWLRGWTEEFKRHDMLQIVRWTAESDVTITLPGTCIGYVEKGPVCGRTSDKRATCVKILMTIDAMQTSSTRRPHYERLLRAI